MNAAALQSLIASAFPNLATTERAAEVATAASQQTVAQAIVTAGVGGTLTAGGPRMGAEAVAQATAYLAESADDHVLDGLAHHVFNVLRTERPGTATQVVIARPKLDIMNELPAMLDAEVAWRIAAQGTGAGPAALATALGYWDRADKINPADPLPSKMLDALQQAGICSADLRNSIIAACTVSQPGPVSTALHDAGLDDATYEDVRAALVAIGGL